MGRRTWRGADVESVRLLMLDLGPGLVPLVPYRALAAPG